MTVVAVGRLVVLCVAVGFESAQPLHEGLQLFVGAFKWLGVLFATLAGLLPSNERGHEGRILAITDPREFKAGEKVFADGTPGRAMYIIMKGEIRISKTIPGLGEEALAILKAGSYFGEMGMLEGLPTSADAWAAKTCVLSTIDRADLLELMEENTDLAVELLWNFVGTLSSRLREANSKVTFLAAAGKF